MVCTTKRLARSMTDTVPPPRLETYAWVPSGVMLMLSGKLPTAIESTSVSSMVSTTDTRPVSEFTTYANAPSGCTATATGAAGVGDTSIGVKVGDGPGAKANTLLPPLLVTYPRSCAVIGAANASATRSAALNETGKRKRML